jgi:hypothetical protein
MHVAQHCWNSLIALNQDHLTLALHVCLLRRPSSPSTSVGQPLQVSKLALLSLMAIFRDILPGYKIRKLSDEELQVQVTKAVKKVRDFEKTLLKAFQAYLKLLRTSANATAASTKRRRYVTQTSRHCSGRLAEMYSSAANQGTACGLNAVLQ